MLNLDYRTITLVVVLEAFTNVVVFMLLFPSFYTTLGALSDTAFTSVIHTVQVVRLTGVGLIAAWLWRRRRGTAARWDPLPSVMIGALLTLTVGMAVAAVGLGGDRPSAAAWLISAGEGLLCPLIGLLLVPPGPAKSSSRRPGVMAWSATGRRQEQHW